MKRLITEHQEKIYRLCSHEFECLSVGEAAERLGITHQAVSDALAQIKKVAPQLFPILTRQERDCLEMLENNLKKTQIAAALQVSERQVERLTAALIEMKKWMPGNKPKIVSYSPEMEKHVERRF